VPPAAAGTATATGAAAAAASGGSNADANPATADTAEGNIAAVEAAERADRERERMLAEDQAAAPSGN
jgi:hypothetical protein